MMISSEFTPFFLGAMRRNKVFKEEGPQQVHLKYRLPSVCHFFVGDAFFRVEVFISYFFPF